MATPADPLHYHALDDEELTVVGLTMASSDMRYTIRAACCHSELVMSPQYVRSMAVWGVTA
jgi:hypothetical protein